MSHIVDVSKYFLRARIALAGPLAMLLLGTVGNASAAVISMSQKIKPNVQVTQATPFGGTLDISSLLAGHRLLGASLRVKASDDSDARSYDRKETQFGEPDSTDTREFPCRPPNSHLTCSSITNSYSRTISVTRIDPLERGVFTVGGQSVAGTTTNYSSDSSNTDYSSVSVPPNILNVYWTMYETYDEWNDRGLDLFIQLNTGNLMDLAADGLLDFSMSAAFGDFDFDELTINFTVDDAPLLPEENDVPEPASLALFALGALAAGVTRKRNQRKAIQG